MAFQQYPRGIRIPTKYGEAVAAFTDGAHAHVEIADGATWSVNGGTVGKVSVHVHLWADGLWHVGREDQKPFERLWHSLYGYRMLSKPSLDDKLTQKQREAIADVLAEAVTAWAGANPDTLAEAQRAHVNNECDRIDDKIAECRAEIDKLHAEREALTASLASAAR